jgi:hypothetical protein
VLFSARSFRQPTRVLISGSAHEAFLRAGTKDRVISNIVVETLRISAVMLENNSHSTFAEVSAFICFSLLLAHLLGMNSAMATIL